MQANLEVLKDPESLPVGNLFNTHNIALMGLTLAVVLLVINQLFNLCTSGIVLMDGRYLNILVSFGPRATFLIFNLRCERFEEVGLLVWALATLALASGGSLTINAMENVNQGGEFAAPPTAQWVAFVFAALVLEAMRRAGGLVLACIVTVAAFYPSFAGYVPAPFSCFQSLLSQTFSYRVYSSESIFGIPMKAFGDVVIGFIIFGAVLQHTGGGSFFNDLALGLVGRYRGGTAKVSIFGIGMTACCYIFLTIALAPALEAGGLNRLSVHLFILYCGMVSYTTPPVALGTYAAATLAKTSPMRAGFEEMRLGSIIYLVPFLFVLNPSLIGHALALEVFVAVTCAFIGVAMISIGLQGYVTFVGTLAGQFELPLRAMLAVGGFFFAMPAMPFAGIGFGTTALLGAALAALPLLVARQRGHAMQAVEAAE